jgi:hypothetical protein
VLAGLLAAAVTAYGDLHRLYQRHVRGEGLREDEHRRLLLLQVGFLTFVIVSQYNLTSLDIHLALFFPLQESKIILLFMNMGAMVQIMFLCIAYQSAVVRRCLYARAGSEST